MSEGFDVTGMSCEGPLMGSWALPSEVVVVADWSLAEMYGMSPEQPEFRMLKQHIRQGAESGDPTKLHLATLVAGQPLTSFVIQTSDLLEALGIGLGSGFLVSMPVKALTESEYFDSYLQSH